MYALTCGAAIGMATGAALENPANRGKENSNSSDFSRFLSTTSKLTYLKKLRQVKLQQKFYLENIISDSDFNYLKNKLLKHPVGDNVFLFRVAPRSLIEPLATDGLPLQEFLKNMATAL